MREGNFREKKMRLKNLFHRPDTVWTHSLDKERVLWTQDVYIWFLSSPKLQKPIHHIWSILNQKLLIIKWSSRLNISSRSFNTKWHHTVAQGRNNKDRWNKKMGWQTANGICKGLDPWETSTLIQIEERRSVYSALDTLNTFETARKNMRLQCWSRKTSINMV